MGLIRSVCITMTIMLAASTLVGCAGSAHQDNKAAASTASRLIELNPGMSKQEVIEILGKPKATEAYVINGEQVEFWLYQTGKRQANEDPGDSAVTPLQFADGVLQGWGRNYYDQVKKHQYEISIENK